LLCYRYSSSKKNQINVLPSCTKGHLDIQIENLRTIILSTITKFRRSHEKLCFYLPKKLPETSVSL
jgi:hypothetical protein